MREITTTPLMIVESPTKPWTLARFLRDRYRAEAGLGHVRDLPENAKRVNGDASWKAPGLPMAHEYSGEAGGLAAG